MSDKRQVIILFIYNLLLVREILGTSFSERKVTLSSFIFEKCAHSLNDPVEFENVNMNVNSEGYTQVWGTMINHVPLQSAIDVSVSMQRSVLGIWLHVPCVDGLGSCHYPDICQYGEPEEEACPQRFIENNVPCRCPIEQGNYTLPEPGRMMTTNLKSAFSGLYRARVIATHEDTELACYTMKFELKRTRT